MDEKMICEEKTNDKVDLTKYPEAFEALKPMLQFLPNEEAKEGLLVGFTFFMAMM